MAGKSPSVQERKIVLRLRPGHLDEAMLLRDYDERSAHLGSADHDYIRRLLVIGHKFESRYSGDVSGNALDSVALSSNESNNTAKEHSSVALTNQSQTADSQATDGDLSEPSVPQGQAIRQLAGVFGQKQTS